MIELLIRYLQGDKEVKEKVEHVADVYKESKPYSSKLFYFFLLLPMFGLLTFSFGASIFLTLFVLLDKAPEGESFWFIVGAVVAIIFTYVFFKLIRKIWKKLKQPIEKEVELKL